ncbi:outer membrane beta-barrel protein [Albibacterium indicum]|uniref:outer membrane beta-barrel protein n=1 Tax=Albibacterium indicum TaxID=2292082 RepID=UPI000E53516D|nr:outer membrane beta-barrel protein [Pedobacter indicus]
MFKGHLLLVLFFLLLSFIASAQVTVSGIVKDSLTNNPLMGARVEVITAADSVIRSTSSGEGGDFRFTNIPNGPYTLKVNFLGFKIYQQQFVLDQNKTEQFNILLTLDMTVLTAVDINAKPPMVVLKGDTTEFDAGAFTTEPYADADALIGQLPGAEIDAEGKLTFQGEEVQRIMVDGKEFFSTDPRIAMKTIPADIISKLQVIDEQSEQAKFTGFDDGERKKVMNIITKPDRRHGYFGKVAGGYGNSEKYNTGGSYNIFNGDKRVSFNAVSNNVNQQDFSMENLAGGETLDQGRNRSRGRGRNNAGAGGSGLRNTNNIAINYNNEWSDQLDLNANYSFNKTDSYTESLVNREYLIGSRSNQLSVQQQNASGENMSHRASFRLEYEVDTNNSISFRPNIQYQQSDILLNSFNRTMLTTQEPVNSSVRDNQNDRNNLNFSGDFTYRRRLNKKGRSLSLSVNGSINSNKGLAYNLSMNEFYEDFLLDRTDTVNNENNTYANGNGLTGRLAYTEPINDQSRLQVNYSIRNTNNYSNRETFEFLAETGQFGELNEQLSNEFRNDYIYHSGGLGYQYNKEDFRFDLGLDMQRAQLQNHQYFPEEQLNSSRFSSYLPNASLTYRFSRNKNIRINYSTATNAPNINQLQNVINNQNSLNIRVGNPDLKQEYGHRFSLRYKTVNRETNANFSTNIDAEFSNNRIVNSTWIADQDTVIGPDLILGKGGRLTRPENVDGYYRLRGHVTLGIPIEKLKINLSLNTGLFHTRDIGMLNNQLSYANSSGINQRIAVNSKISQKIIFSFSYGGNYSVVRNNMNPDLSYNFYNQNLRNDFTFIFMKGIRISSTFNYNYNTGLTNDDSQRFVLWNASLGKKLFSRQQGEIALSAYDILNTNTNISRDISEQFIEDRESNMLNQYFIVSFTYNLRKFGGRPNQPARM